jgi:cytochrome b6-f complex iron-sulfur subunit
MRAEDQDLRQPDAEAPTLSRRRLITTLLGFSVVTTLGGVLAPILGYLWPSSQASATTGEPVKVGTTTDFPVGKGKVVSVHDKPVIVINTAEGGVKAFSAICTHLGCIVGWDANRRVIVCPCHDAHFNPVNGAVISGPAPAPLAEFPLTAQGDAYYVSQA